MKSPRAQELFANWDQLFREPFRGITTCGQVIPDLYSMWPDGAPTLAMIETVNSLLGRMTPEKKQASCFPAGSSRCPNREMEPAIVLH